MADDSEYTRIHSDRPAELSENRVIAEDTQVIGPSSEPIFTLEGMSTIRELPFFAQGTFRPEHFRHPLDFAFERPEDAYLYVVITECGKYYVGITERPLQDRWREHMGIEVESGAEFLKDKEISLLIYVSIVPLNNARYVEQQLTLQLAVKYGIKNVTGGVYAEGRDMKQDVPTHPPEEYDYLSKVHIINSDPIPPDQAHPDFTPSYSNRSHYELVTLLIILLLCAALMWMVI